MFKMGAQWLSGRALDSRPKSRGFEPHRRHCVVSLSKNINPSLVLVQPRKTRPFITERLLMGQKNQIKQTKQTMFKIVKTTNTHRRSMNMCVFGSEPLLRAQGALHCYFIYHKQPQRRRKVFVQSTCRSFGDRKCSMLRTTPPSIKIMPIFWS